MEVDEDIHDPDSNIENLVHQVEEQSEFCDVTVRFGDWTKKFHRCVLSASLLFQTMINEQIVKTAKGNGDANTDKLPHAQLKVKRGSSSEIVEMAIMYMYGIIPNFNIRNIGDFLELAEHLKIKELQDSCVDWLNDIDYSEINCIHVFHLSRKYKIEITHCIKYIESHIPETFLHADAVDLPTDFVGYLFTDVKFSYVDMEDKLNFLVKLANKQSTGSTQETIVQLFKTLDLKKISEPSWEYAKCDINFSRMVNLGNKVRSTDRENSKICVMIIPFKEDYFACLDLQNDSWYRLNSDYFERYSCDEQNILGIRNNNPEVYFKDKYFCGEYLALTSVDLESDQIRRHSIELLDFDNFLNDKLFKEDITHVNFINNTLIVILKKTIRLNSISCESESENELECFCSYQRKEGRVDNTNDTNEAVQAHVPPEIIPDTSTGGVCCTIPTPGITVDEPSTSGLSTSDCERESVTIVTNVFVGNISEEEEEHDDDDAEEIEMKPLFSFCKEKKT